MEKQEKLVESEISLDQQEIIPESSAEILNIETLISDSTKFWRHSSELFLNCHQRIISSFEGEIDTLQHNQNRTEYEGHIKLSGKEEDRSKSDFKSIGESGVHPILLQVQQDSELKNEQKIQIKPRDEIARTEACITLPVPRTESPVNKDTSPVETKAYAKSCSFKRKRVRRAATLKKKSFPPNLEGDEDEGKQIKKRCTSILNCVMCSQNFSELMELESHVRSHDEVVHFSLILRSLVSLLYSYI